jgi:hypothetical protein
MNNVDDNKTKMFIAILDVVSKHFPHNESRSGKQRSETLRSIVMLSKDLTLESMIYLDLL